MMKAGWLHVFILRLNDTTLIVYLNKLTRTDFQETFWWDLTQVGMIRAFFLGLNSKHDSEHWEQPLKEFDLNPDYTWLVGLTDL